MEDYILPYIPYNVNCEILNYKSDYVGEQYNTIKGFYRYSDDKLYFNFKYGRDYAGKNTDEFKLILRPLSNLMKDEFKMDDWRKKAILFLDETANLPYNNRLEHIGGIMYSDIKFLLKNHFDIFGLIQKGSAVDINTIK